MNATETTKPPDGRDRGICALRSTRRVRTAGHTIWENLVVLAVIVVVVLFIAPVIFDAFWKVIEPVPGDAIAVHLKESEEKAKPSLAKPGNLERRARTTKLGTPSKPKTDSVVLTKGSPITPAAGRHTGVAPRTPPAPETLPAPGEATDADASGFTIGDSRTFPLANGNPGGNRPGSSSSTGSAQGGAGGNRSSAGWGKSSSGGVSAGGSPGGYAGGPVPGSTASAMRPNHFPRALTPDPVRLLGFGDGPNPGTIDLTSGIPTISLSGGPARPPAVNSTGLQTGGFTKTGPGTIELTGPGAYTGLTTVSDGTLRLNRSTPDSRAIPGDGVYATTDVLINGGTLEVAASEQIGDNARVVLNSGTFTFSGSNRTESIGAFTNNGGTFTTGTGTGNLLRGTGATITWAGGTNTITTGNTVSDQHWIITGGTNTVNAGGTLTVATGTTAPFGLFFGGTSSPTITLNSSAGTAGQMLLNQDVTVDGTLTSGTAQILSGGALANPGFVDMQGGTRTFNVNDGSAATDLLISAKLQNGGLVKSGAGTMTLTGAIAYGGGTTVNAGTLILDTPQGSSGVIGGIAVTGGTLQVGTTNATASYNTASQALRSNAVTLSAGASLTTGAATGTTGATSDLRVGSISGTGGSITPGNNGAVQELALSDATFSGAVTTTGGLNLRGGNGTTQTFNGNLTGLTGTIGINSGATMKLSGTGDSTSGVLASTALALRGGSITLDNSGGNTSAAAGRISDSAAVTSLGGTFSLIGSNSGTSEAVGGLTLNSGYSTINVTHSAASAPTVLTFASLTQGSTGVGTGSNKLVATVNFTNSGGTLGSAGNNPRIIATGTTAGFIGPWALANGSNYAVYDTTNGVRAATSADYSVNYTNTFATTLAQGAYGSIEQSTASLTWTGSSAYGTGNGSYLRINPGSSGQSLTFSNTGTTNINLAGILLAGSNDYTISDGGGSNTARRLTGTGGPPRYIGVANAGTTLNMGLNIGGPGTAIVKFGDGILNLTADQSGSNFIGGSSTLTTMYIAGGVLRVTVGTNGSLTNGSGQSIAFRGGVLEIANGGNGTGASADFTRGLGIAATNVSWDNGGSDRGDGGFSAINSDASVSIGGATPSTLTWNGSNFVQNGYALLFGSTKATNRITLQNNIGLDNGTATNNYFAREIRVAAGVGGDSTRLSGVISGSANADLLKTGAGVLELTGTNTYAGNTLIQQGTLIATNGAAIADTSAVVLSNTAGATFQLNNSETIGALSGGGTTAGNVALQANTLTVGDQRDSTFGGVISSTTNAGSLVKQGSGTLTLTNVNTYTGTTTVSAGVLSVATIGNGGVAGGIGQATNAAANLVFDGGTLQYTGSTTTSDRAFTINAGKTATIDVTNGLALAGATGTTTTGALTKIGAGTLTLTGTSTYSGTTTISQGTLALGASASINNSATINVTGGATFDVSAVSGGYSLTSGQTLKGIGTVSGAATVLSGATLSPGNSPGTLTIGALTLNGGGNYNWQLFDAGSTAGTGWDLMNINGALTIAATSGNKFNINLWTLSGILPDVNGDALNFNSATNYTWTLATASGGISGFSANAFAINTSATNGANGFSNSIGGGTFSLAASGNNLNLVFTAAPVGTDLYWSAGTWGSTALGTGANGTWQDGSGSWDPSKTANFAGTAGTVTIGAGNATASKGINFLTDGYSVSGGTITLSATGTDNVITTANAVTATVSSTLATSAGITKSGAGTLVFNSAQTYTGGTTISAGTLQLGDGATDGNVATGSAIIDNATLAVNNTSAQGIAGDISGTGALTKTGAGTLTLSGTNSYAGKTTITGGLIAASGESKFGTDPGSFTPDQITLDGGGIQAAGNINFNSNRGLTLGAGGGTFDTNGNTITLTNVVAGTAGGALTKTGAGTLVFAGADTYNGATNIQNGTAQLNVANAMPTGTTLTLGSTGNSAILDLGNGASSFNQQIAGLTTAGTAASQTITNGSSGTGTATLTVNNDTTTSNADFTFGGVIQDGATAKVALTKTGSKTLTLTNANTYTGTTTITAGTLQLGSGGTTGSLATGSTITDNGNLTINRSNAVAQGTDFSGAAITGTGSLTQAGSGTTTLTAANTFSGGSTLAAGGLTVGATGSLIFGGSNVAVTVTGNNATLTNLGTIDQTGGARGVFNNASTGLVINNGSATNSTALIRTANGDVVRSNTGSVTLNNYGTLTSLNGAAGGSQAVDFNPITTGSNIINNFSTGVMQASEADAVRPGVNGAVSNSGLIKSTWATASSGSSSDGIDAQNNTGVAITNASNWSAGSPATPGTGTIEGARDGITGGAVNSTVTFTTSVTNYLGGIIKGNNGSGINLDGFNANQTATIINNGTITGNGRDIANGVSHDGDGIDVDGLVNVTNTGIIRSINSFNIAADGVAHSEGITVGGGTITNSGTIEGLVATGNTNAIGIGISLLGNDITSGPLTGTREAIYGNAIVTNQTGGLIRGDSGSGILVDGPASGFTVTINNNAGATIQGGATLAGLGGTSAAILTGADNDTINNAGTIDGSSNGKAIDMGAGNNTLNITGGAASVLGDISGGTGGTNAMTLDPGTGNSFSYAGSISNFNTVEIKSGTVTFSGASTYAGATQVTGGTLEVTSNNALGTTAAGTIVSNGATLKLTGVNYSTAEALTINGNGVSNGGALLNSGTSTYAGQITVATDASISAGGGTLNLTGGLVKDGTKLTFTGGGTINVSTVGISGASAHSDLIVDGTTVNLNVANTYNGPTFIRNSATLNANVAGALPTATRTDVTFDGTGTSVLTLGANQVAASLTSSGAATVTLNTNTLTIGAASGSTTFAGSIGGAGGLTKDGASTQVLTGTNGYTGATLVSGGTLAAGADGALGFTSGITVNSGGTLLLNGSGDRINDAAGITLAGGTFNTNGLSETLGVFTLSANSIIDMAGGASVLHFADSSGAAWSGTLSIWNWSGNPIVGGGADRIFFDGTVGLTNMQLAQIHFYTDNGATMLSFDYRLGSGELVPAPEPTTILGALGLLGFLGYRERRRLRRLWNIAFSRRREVDVTSSAP